MAFRNNFFRWIIKQIIKIVIDLIVIAIFIGTLIVLYRYVDGSLTLLFFIFFGAAYIGVIHNLINSFVDEVLMKN